MTREKGEYIKKEDLFAKTIDKNSIWLHITNSEGKNLKEIVEALSALSVPEREKGEWFAITQPWADTQIFKCTCCGRHIEVPQYEVSTLTIRYPFCHCGADMRC